jgi:cell wall-associated NlpC family hydrolase
MIRSFVIVALLGFGFAIAGSQISKSGGASRSSYGATVVVKDDSDRAEMAKAMRERAAEIALQYVGKPYRWGGADPATGCDCSHLIYSSYHQAGLDIPQPPVHSQETVGVVVQAQTPEILRGGKRFRIAGDMSSWSLLKRGDRLVFHRDASDSAEPGGHFTGIYLGEYGSMHHAFVSAHASQGIAVSSLEQYVATYRYAIRDAIAGSASESSAKGEKLLAVAKKYLETPYKWGGDDPIHGIDNSHFVHRVFIDAGFPCPTAPVHNQETFGTVVQSKDSRIERGGKWFDVGTNMISLDLLQPGDRLIFQKDPASNRDGNHHTGIYIGRYGNIEHAMVHCASRVGVSIVSLENYWQIYRYAVRD